MWHIAQTDEAGQPVLGHADGRPIHLGVTLRVEGRPVLCGHGLHACERLIDCLAYAQGTVICRVTLGGETVAVGDKTVAQERTVLAWTTAEAGERILRAFTLWCALSVAHLWDMPAVVRRYLETGDESLRRDAAYAAYAAALDAGKTEQEQYLLALVEAELRED